MSAHPYSSAVLRRGAWHFLSGKTISGLLTFVILLWLVRLLPVAEYGAYVSLIAATELGFAIGGLGLPWAAARFLPEARLRANPDIVRSLAWRLLRWQAGFMFLLAALVGLTFHHLLPVLGLTVPVAAAATWAGLIFVEGSGRCLREGLLSPLLQQSLVRSSLIARQTLFIILLGLLFALDRIGLVTVLAVELTASLLAGLIALVGLSRYLHALPEPQHNADWQAPSANTLWCVALPMYGGHLLTLTYSPQIFLLLLNRFSGIEVTATFGFLRNLYEQVARYLPATLLFGLVRPKLVASYADGGGMAELSRNANLAGKLSLFTLMPVVGFSFAGGETLISLLSGGKFPHTGLLFFGFMLALVPFSQRQLLETVAVTTGRATLCTLGSAAGLLTLPLMLWMLSTGFGAWAGVLALGGGHLLFVLLLAGGLDGVGYQADHVGLAKLFLAAAAGALAATALPGFFPAWLNLASWATVAGLVFLAGSWLLGPFSRDELRRMNRLLGRRLFHA
ncbi:MAG TPA: oligosaccharide flippase family protein [Candidatus Desulfobacillus sp.]|nr:oligosaccharide flippase family protein [Candidatus Desulfobacillus sp.]